ncbi:MAG: AgmX/PglI C-terminal domain-containing protein [Kofleriaceae bacterium]|nr:AgmX/PglI C-terminal domain-containing protein [Kofleriaceae bacterium]
MSAQRTAFALPPPDTTNDELGAKAIEVATMLGDSVVDVKHCMDPQSGKITPRTWGMLATGAVSLIVSAIAFYVSVHTAAFNKGALDYWTRVAHKPAHGFRPEMLSAGYDWLAFGGFALGLVTLAMALFRIRRELKSPYYRIGTAPGVEQPVTGAPAEDFPLVAPRGDDFVFNFGAGITGEMSVNGKTVGLAELAASGQARPSTTTVGAFELPIPLHSRIRANIGNTQFLVSGVAKPRTHAAPLMALESRTLSYFAGSLAVHLGIVLLFQLMPIESSTASWELATQEPTGIESHSKVQEDAVLEPEDADKGGAGAAASGKAMALNEGQAGTTKSTNVDGHMRIKDNGLPPQLARAQAIEEARTAGILGSTRLMTGDAFASLTATDNLSSGADGVNVWGPIYGADGEGHGFGGYGRQGFGGGGGCLGGDCGIIGTKDGYGKLGLGKFPGSGWDVPGGGIPGGKRHTPNIPKPIVGTPTGTPGLDKEMIRRYIRRNIAKISYCYEKELLANPGLAGDVQIAFFIQPDGTVTGSTGKGVSPAVANCVADVVGGIEFPKAAGGVQVNYPFTFRPAQ